MNFRIRHTAIILVVMIVSSCTEIIDIQLDSSYTRLVVYGEITTDSVLHEIALTTSSDYFSNETAPTVSGASVVVSFNDTSIVYLEKQGTSGIYVPPRAFRGKPGTEYILDIQNVDIDGDGIDESYSASTTMPSILAPDSLQLQRFVAHFFSGYQVLLYAPDPPGPNWYNFKLYHNDISLNATLADYLIQPDEFVVNGYIYAFPVAFLDDEEEDEFLSPGDTVRLEINSVPEDYYAFVSEAQNEIFGNNPLFSGPPANVSTNISNNGLGMFTAYSKEEVIIIYK